MEICTYYLSKYIHVLIQSPFFEKIKIESTRSRIKLYYTINGIGISNDRYFDAVPIFTIPPVVNLCAPKYSISIYNTQQLTIDSVLPVTVCVQITRFLRLKNNYVHFACRQRFSIALCVNQTFKSAYRVVSLCLI